MARAFVLLAFSALVAGAAAQVARPPAVDPKKGIPLLIQPGNTTKLIWKTSPPHPDAVMCCGGVLQLSWSPMDSGVDHSVVLNIDDTCPNTLKNQQYVQYIYQAAPRGLVTLDFNQNGDYYISDAVANHCSQGMQFLLAVRGCPADNTIYAPTVPINVNCRATAGAAAAPAAAAALGAGTGGAPGAAAGMTPAQREAAEQQQRVAAQAAARNKAGNGAGAAGRGGAAVAAAAVAAAVLAAL